MKSFFILNPVPKLAQNLTGGGNSPPLVDNSTERRLLRLQTWVCSLSLVNLFRWFRELPNPRWSVGAGFLILSVYSFPLQAGTISTIAGDGTRNFSGDGGPATSAQLDWPEGVAIDSSGNLYIADRGNSRVRKIAANGTINTIAGIGTSWNYNGDNISATTAQLGPEGLAIDGSGNLYIADFGNHRIRKITGTTISTVAGSATTGIGGFSGDNGPATSAQLNYPMDVAVDGSGNIYIADTSNHSIRKVTGTTITTVAGNGVSGFGGDNGPATSAQLSSPMGVTVDGSGNLYIADSDNRRIRKVTGGIITTVAGAGQGYSGDGGPATSALLNLPIDVVVSSGNLYIVDRENHNIRRVTNGIIVTAAGNGGAGFGGDGGSSGLAQLSQPYSVAVDGSGNLYIADSGNHRIRKVLAPQSQTISFTAPSTGTSPGGSASLTATANATSGLPVTFASTTTSICTVSGTTVTYIGAGTCTLTANQVGNADYLPAPPVSGNVTVINNNPPTANSGTLVTTEDTVGSGTLTASDVEANPLTYNIVTNGSKGTATITSTGAYTYTPTLNQNGTDTFTFKAYDGTGYSSPATITVTITAVNDAPLITGQTALSSNEDTSLTLTFANLTVTDIDNPYPTGFTLTTQSGSNYTFSGNTITPAANFNGTLTVPVKVNDGGLDSNIYNLTVTVNAVNDAPVATAGSLTTNEDIVGNGTLTASDVEASPLTYYLVTDGSQGNAVINTITGAYTYTPTANLNSSDSFTFRVNDGTADSTPATITVTITPVNDIPTFTASNPPAVLENSGTQTLPGWATFDPGPNETDNVLTYTVSNVSNPALFSSLPNVNTSGTLTYTLATNQSGTSTFDVTVQDTGGTANGGVDLSTTSQFTLGVNAPELQVRQGTTVQTNGSSYDFGAILITQSSPVITFTIDNLGNADLFLTGIPKLAITGTAAVDFKLTDQTTDTIIPGAKTTFTVMFVPTVMGSRTATLTILSNDGDEAIDTLTLQGQSLTPNVRVSQGSAEILMGSSFDIGTVGMDHLAAYPFTIENVGNSDLRLTGNPLISLGGMNAGEFSVDDTATQSLLKSGENTQFLLNLIPLSVGPKTVTLFLPNDDLEQGNYTFTVTALGGVYKYLQVTLAGSGQGTVTSQLPDLTCLDNLCQQPIIDAPQWVYLTALPAAGSAFTGWSGDPACQSNGKVLILADTACQATFELQSYELTVGRLGQGHVTGPGIDCPSDCTETFLYGTEIQLAAEADRRWIHTGWKGRCDQTGKVQVTNAHLCQAVFEPDRGEPNVGDGNGDGVLDAYQPNVISLPDKVGGNYVTFEVQPDTCVISDVYTDLPGKYGTPDKNKPLPQGLIYFELACPQAQISMYYHAVSVMRRNFIFQKFGPRVPGDLNTVDWFTLPNVTFEAVRVGEKSVVKATYTITDGGLGDSTGVDGRIVDPGGLGLQ